MYDLNNDSFQNLISSRTFLLYDDKEPLARNFRLNFSKIKTEHSGLNNIKKFINKSYNYLFKFINYYNYL